MTVANVPGVSASPAWIAAYPGACVGVLYMTSVRNPENDPAYDAALDRTAAVLRERYLGAARADLLAMPELATYAAYYRRFDKTYHVLLQLESVVLKEKPLRARGTLVAAMFASELKTGLLTAAHDVSSLAGGLTVDIVVAGDGYTGIGGREVRPMPGDMCIRDEAGIVASIVYGPDDRTRLTPDTTAVVFTTYAPAGIGAEAVRRQLESIAADVRIVAPDAAIERISIVEAGGSLG